MRWSVAPARQSQKIGVQPFYRCTPTKNEELLAFLHRDLPGGVSGFLEIGNFMAVGGTPLWDGIGGLGAVEVDDKMLTGIQGLDYVLGFNQWEWADCAERI